ncbi:hypothetical protein KCU88_g419, partial [Aureobasidium melanogenum]
MATALIACKSPFISASSCPRQDVQGHAVGQPDYLLAVARNSQAHYTGGCHFGVLLSLHLPDSGALFKGSSISLSYTVVVVVVIIITVGTT